MFERYTEKARRVIFFARYEASQFGSPFIETEHILLGLLREDKGLMLRLKIEDPSQIRQQIETHIPHGPSLSTSIDLPLSSGSKRALKEAAEQADALKHRHIGTEHLLLGLFNDENCFATEILRKRGFDPKKLRERLIEPLREFLPSVPPPQARTLLRRNTVELHGAQWDAEYIHNRVKSCAEIFWHWQKQPWKARDIAVHRGSGRITFDLTLAENPQSYEIVKAGWKKDHCVVCRWELFESSDDSAHGVGYSNGRDWLCAECFEKFLANPNYFGSNYPEIT